MEYRRVTCAKYEQGVELNPILLPEPLINFCFKWLEQICRKTCEYLSFTVSDITGIIDLK